MRLTTLVIRSLGFYRRSHLAVALGVLAGSAALTGALLVGDSMRASLREVAVGRLATVDHALLSSVYFREELAENLAASPGFSDQFSRAVPAIILRGGATHAQSGARVEKVNILGVDDRFWPLAGDGETSGNFGDGRTVLLNSALAEELAAGAGDDVLLRIGKPSLVPNETLLGRRDQATLGIRRSVAGVIGPGTMGSFSLNPKHAVPKNAYLRLSDLQERLEREGLISAILVAGIEGEEVFSSDHAIELQAFLKSVVTLDDLGLRLRVDAARGYLSLESERFLLEPAVEEAARSAAEDVGVQAGLVLTYLANEISVDPVAGAGQASSIPYSTVTALDAAAINGVAMPLLDGSPAPPLGSRQVYLNQWTAQDLSAAVGDSIVLSYFVNGDFGELVSERETFILAGILGLSDGAYDPGFTPQYKGVTDVDTLAEWDPPFEFDQSKIRAQDETYWDEYRTSPKAFVSFNDGAELWAEEAERFGRVTSIRIIPGDAQSLATVADQFESALLDRLDLTALGLSFDPVREEALVASTGSTDFGGLFIGFSFFLIISAALLVALLFRLGVDRRASEVGLMLAVGFSPTLVTRVLLAEGAVLAGIGGLMGLLCARGYAWLMLAGLRSWWSEAVNTPFLNLHTSALSYMIGFVASFLVGLLSIAWSIRGLTRNSPRSLVAGVVQSGRQQQDESKPRRGAVLSFGAALLAVVLIVLPAISEAVSPTIGFFGGGSLMLVSALAMINHWVRGEHGGSIERGGTGAMIRLGIRNAPRNAGRSMLTISLIASATFVISALQAFWVEVDPEDLARDSGSGGFALYGESAIPLDFDLNTPGGRESLSLGDETRTALADASVIPFRLRPGDEASCMNLYLPTKPRIIGAPEVMIKRGGFKFSSSLAESQVEYDNPWILLDRDFDDGVIPVIGDESAVMWQLHSGLGKDFPITDGRGKQVTLRFVALLKGSSLQDELIVSEAQFKNLFPAISGYGFFLVEVDPDAAEALTTSLERDLEDYGLDIAPTAQRLRGYVAVQNTYLSTFQTLGGLGLVLGTIGMGAVLLRNVWERRAELALMRALGFSAVSLGWMVLAENGILVLAGLAAGFVPALVAIAPHIIDRPESLPFGAMALTLAGVFAVGMLSGVVALVPTLRSPLLTSLRSE